MKLIFFLIAFFLIFLRVFITGPWYEKRGKGDVTISISNGDDYEQIRYGGKITLTADETAIKSISPGGYIKYRKNDKKLMAVSDLQGNINYTFSDNGNIIYPADKGKELIAEALKEMIAYGFDAPARMERIYASGGRTALLKEMHSIKAPGVAGMFRNKIFTTDSFTDNEMPLLIKEIGSLGSDHDKVSFLNKVTIMQLKDSQTARAWFGAVEQLGSDLDKVNILNGRIKEDTLTEDIFNNVLGVATRLGSDMDKENILKLLINKKGITEEGWINIIIATARLRSDAEKSNVLVLIAQKMPDSEAVKTSYIKIAKSINNDSDAGKALKAVR